MNITIFKNFSKRANSTKQPNASNGVVLSAHLKEMTSVENPSFIIKRTDDFESINYVQALNHYYKVDDTIILDNDRIELRCSQDLLATFKSNINALTTRVIYSSSEYDLSIRDNRTNVLSDVTYLYPTTSTDAQFETTGCYMLSVMNGKSSGTGGIATYYTMNETTLSNISNKILNTPSFFEQLKNQFSNPMDAIISCIWLPLPYNFVSGTNQNVFLGAQDTEIQARKLNERVRHYTFNISFDEIFEDNYTDITPYSTCVLYLPFVGGIDLDLSLTYKNYMIQGDIYVDGFTGDVIYVLDIGDEVITYTGNCATKLPISSMAYNPTSALTSIASSLGAYATGNLIGTVAGAVGVVDAFKVNTRQNGCLSSALGAYAGTELLAVVYKHELTDDIESLKDTQGLPCYKVLQLGTLTGYVQTENASVNIAGRTTDASEINAMLDSGIFIE